MPTILIDPLPRTLDLICDPVTRAKLESLGHLIIHETGRMPDEMVDKDLAEVSIIMGQTKLPRERLHRAKNLKAIIDVETNFTDAIDYDYCFANGIHVLTPASAFADAVAESALGMTIDLARGITKADRDFRLGREAYGLDGNIGSFSLRGATVGLIGYGDLARSFHKLIAPFQFPNLRTPSFFVLDNLKLPQAAVRINTDRIANQFVFADYLIQHKPSQKCTGRLNFPNLLVRASHLDPRLPLKVPDLLCRQRDRRRNKFLTLRKYQCSRLLHTHVLLGNTGRGGNGDNRGGRKPADIECHKKSLSELIDVRQLGKTPANA